MADIDIPQAEAGALMAMEKRCAEEMEWLFPAPGDRLAILLKISCSMWRAPVRGWPFEGDPPHRSE